MKKFQILTVGLLLTAGAAIVASCSNSKKGTADSDTTVAVAEAVVPTPEYSELAKAFQDTTKRAETATDTTYAVTPTGLKYMILAEGKGKQPTAADEVTVHYTGELLNGQVFDSSVSRGEPATFPLNRVIPGWTEGLQLMKEGGKAVFYIPSNLAYGSAGAPPMIGPDEDLIFTVELISVGQQ